MNFYAFEFTDTITVKLPDYLPNKVKGYSIFSKAIHDHNSSYDQDFLTNAQSYHTGLSETANF